MNLPMILKIFFISYHSVIGDNKFGGFSYAAITVDFRSFMSNKTFIKESICKFVTNYKIFCLFEFL